MSQDALGTREGHVIEQYGGPATFRGRGPKIQSHPKRHYRRDNLLNKHDVLWRVIFGRLAANRTRAGKRVGVRNTR